MVYHRRLVLGKLAEREHLAPPVSEDVVVTVPETVLHSEWSSSHENRLDVLGSEVRTLPVV